MILFISMIKREKLNLDFQSLNAKFKNISKLRKTREIDNILIIIYNQFIHILYLAKNLQ